MATLPHSRALRLPQRAPSLRMARGRKTSLPLALIPTERQTLLAWQHSTTIPACVAADGVRNVIAMVCLRAKEA